MHRRFVIAALVAVPALGLGAPKDQPKEPKDAPKEPPPPAEPAAGSGSAAATPADGSGSGSAVASAALSDADALRQEYLSLRDELFKSRARASAVASQLYSTRVTMRFHWDSARYYGVTKASIRLDGANVYEDITGAIGNDDGVRFDGYIAPGRHVVTYHLEATGKDDDAFTSSTESTLTILAVQGKDLMVAAKAHDSGDISYEWKKSQHGGYALGLDVAVKAVPHGEADRERKK